MISKLSELRQGTPVNKKITLRENFEVAVVILPTDIMMQIEQEVQEYLNANESKVNQVIKNQLFDIKLCYHAMRNPSNLLEKVAKDEKEVAELLDQEDIGRVTTAFGELMINKSPKIELMSEEEFDELKKNLAEMSLKDLSTVSLVHLTNFHQTIHSKN